MTWVTWILVGLVAGFLAKLVMPGTRDEPSGWLGTILLGIVGAVIGGWIWNIAFNNVGANAFDVRSIFIALIGSIVVIGLMRLFTSSRTVS